MKLLTQIVLIFLSLNLILSLPFCTKSNTAPSTIEIDKSKTINPIIYNNEEYSAVYVGNRIFLDKNTYDNIHHSSSVEYNDSKFCPDNFKIPTQSDYEDLIKYLGSRAYSVFTSKGGFNMEAGRYYLTNTIQKDPSESYTFKKMFLYLDGKSLKFIRRHPFESGNSIRCMLKMSDPKYVLPFNNRDLEINEKINIKINKNAYMNGFLWKIDNQIFNTENVDYTFTKSGENMIEFWGKYINGEDIYLCDYIYVNKKAVSSEQIFKKSKIKTIQTNFKMKYKNWIHFENSNCPVAPRDNGGYYIAVSDTNSFLHVLSYDKNDKLLKDLNTTVKANPIDITATNYGFAVYMREVVDGFSTITYYSYINLYNKKYALINTIPIMNNKDTDDENIDSTLEKQLIKYDSSGSPVFGMRFMYRPDSGKLIYSRGRIFLIFSHYNYFINNGGHTGDTIATFNDILLDVDYGVTWGASHSLIQSATFDDNYFWTAALSDAYPEGIKVTYTSKKNFTNEYDPINKKYNSRVSITNNDLAGYIKGYHTGPADGKLGGMLYFEKYKLYCLVYAKTPNYSDDSSKNGKTIIFVTTWNFEDNKITNNKTYEIKVFNEGYIMQIRAGKYGNDNIIIIYNEIQEQNNGYGNMIPGTIPKMFVLRAHDMKIIINDVVYDDKLLMNTNEDLRTFRDGVLIWAAADKDKNLVINKIGTPLLDDSYEDNDYIITKSEVEAIKRKMK